MRELTPQSTAAPAPPPMPPGIPPIPPEAPPVPETPTDDDPPAAIPPIIDPDDFGDYHVFRETFLLYVPDQEFNAALRTTGKVLFEMILEYWHYWPDHPEGFFRAALRAAIADVRHIQGFLAETASEGSAYETPHEEYLAEIAREIGAELGKVVDRLEGELGSWRG